MGWTDPPTFTYDQLVDETDLNTYVRDNLNYLKDDPVIASGTGAAVEANNGTTTAITLAATIPSDIGACYVEAWAQYSGLGSVNLGWLAYGGYVAEASAGTVANGLTGSIYWSGGSYLLNPLLVPGFYIRSGDLSWAGTSRTLTLYCYGGNGIGYLGPSVLRVIRSY